MLSYLHTYAHIYVSIVHKAKRPAKWYQRRWHSMLVFTHICSYLSFSRAQSKEACKMISQMMLTQCSYWHTYAHSSVSIVHKVKRPSKWYQRRWHSMLVFTHICSYFSFQPCTKQRGLQNDITEDATQCPRIDTHVLIIMFQSCTNKRGLQNDIKEYATQCSYLHTYAHIYLSVVHEAKMHV